MYKFLTKAIFLKDYTETSYRAGTFEVMVYFLCLTTYQIIENFFCQKSTIEKYTIKKIYNWIISFFHAGKF